MSCAKTAAFAASADTVTIDGSGGVDYTDVQALV